MSEDNVVATAEFSGKITFAELTLQSLRFGIARVLIVFCFVWPFFNFRTILPDSPTEINFLPVFMAAAFAPELLFRDPLLLLSLPVFGVALLGAPVSAALRLAVAIIPLLFIFNLATVLRRRGTELLPHGLAYRALQLFVLFSLVQAIQFNLLPIIPDFVTQVLMTIIPRYSGMPYDELGMRGVQGWASEPSSAALTCITFAVAAIYDRPDRRWRVLVFFIFLLVLNKSIYCLLLAAALAVGCILTLRTKRYALLVFLPLCGIFLAYIASSTRVEDFRTSLLISGMDRQSNPELLRLLQIVDPLVQFPHIYQPVVIGTDWVSEPMGLLPLVAGYGSIFGAVWLCCVAWNKFDLQRMKQRPFAAVTAFTLLIIAPPDFIPLIATLSLFVVAREKKAFVGAVAKSSNWGRLRRAVAVGLRGPQKGCAA